MGQPLSPTRLMQIRDLVRQGCRTKEIGKQLGVSESIVSRVRQGRYRRRPEREDAPVTVPRAVWCPACRCHIYPPCQVCRLRRESKRVRQAPLRPQRAQFKDAGDARLRVAVSELALPVRVINLLEGRRILTVGDLLQWSPDELLRLPNFAGKTLQQVYRALERHGFRRSA